MKKEEVESLIAETKEALKKSTAEDKTIFPWDDVFESMLAYPDRVTVNDGKEQAETSEGCDGKEQAECTVFPPWRRDAVCAGFHHNGWMA